MSDASPQQGILELQTPVARSLAFRVAPEADVAGAVRRLRERFTLDRGVVGLGQPLVLALRKQVAGLRTFPALAGPGCSVPSTQHALWFLLRGSDRGVLFDASQELRGLLGEAFIAEDAMDLFQYAGGRDLTRFEDGTENPRGERAVSAAIVASGPLAGSSFAAVQRWVHDLERFRRLTPEQRNQAVGRDAETNEELPDAPATAHVKRAAQESYDPPAFMVRRSMPWAGESRQGLEFISFVESLDRFERMLRRMVGEQDGLVDGLFTFSHPVTGGYYWLPPVRADRLDLGALGL